MTPAAYYNEIDPFCCNVLRARIADGRRPPGTVDERDVREVKPDDIPAGQVHLFAGIGGFGYAARLAGLPDDFSIWTGGFPCQDISTAGKGAGLSGTRSGLFFEIVRLLHGVRRRPGWVLLENVPALRTRGADRVIHELERAGYAVWPLVVGAWAVGAPHKRDRVWIVGRLADAELDARREQEPGREAEGRTAVGGAGQVLADAESRGFGAGGGARNARHVDERGKVVADAECGAGRRGTRGQGLHADGPEARRQQGERGPLGCGQEGLADAEQHGRPARGRVPEDEGRQGCGRGEPAGGVQLADTDEPRRQEHPRIARDSRKERAASLGSRWPSRPGEPQHDWEAPRLTQFRVGGPVDGPSPELVQAIRDRTGWDDARAEAWWQKNAVRVARRQNRDGLKACGNAIVPQVAALILQSIASMEPE